MPCPEQAVVLARARELGRPVYGEAYVNARNMAVLEVYMPVQQGRSRWGGRGGVFHRAHGGHLVPSWFGEKYRLTFSGGRATLATNSAVRSSTRAWPSVSLDPPGNGLSLQATAYRTEGELPRASRSR
jgi:hypothetical protein